MEEQKKDLWWVGVDVCFHNWADEEAYFILSSRAPITGMEAARLSCVWKRRHQGLPNGEFPSEFTGTAYEMRDGTQVQVKKFSYFHRKGARSVYDGRWSGDGEMEWENDTISVIGFDWKRLRWGGYFA